MTLQRLALLPALLAFAGCESLPQVGVAGAPVDHEMHSLHRSAAKLTAAVPIDKLTTASRQLALEGIKALDAKQFDKASALFNLALKTDVNNSYLHFLNGLTYHLRAINGEGSLYPLAQQGYSMAVQFDPSNNVARHHLGLLYLDRREFTMAKVQLMEAVLYDRDDVELLYDLAFAAYYAKDPASAMAALQGILAVPDRPKDPQIYRALAIVAAAGGDDAAARRFLAALAEMSPKGSDYRFTERRVDSWRDSHTSNFIKTQFSAPAAGGAPQQGGLPQQPGAAAPQPASPQQGGAGGFFEKNMVLLDVAIIATEEDVTDTSGVNLLDGLRIQFGNSSGSPAIVRNSTSDLVNAGNNTRSITRIIQIPSITYTLNIANAQDRRNEVLARPTLVALGGQPSTFFSGTDVIGAAVSSGQGGSVQVQKEAGVKLSVTPEFLPDGLIKIQVAAERTFLTTPNSSVVFDFRLDTSKTLVNANVVMKHGESLILSGLSERNTENNASGTPLLKDIPIVQYLFNRTTRRDFHKSVLIIVTPRRPNYTNRDQQDIDADASRMSEFEKVQAEFEGKYRLWFRPVPATATALSQLETSSVFREFRSGDLPLESWRSRSSLGGRLRAALTMLYY